MLPLTQEVGFLSSFLRVIFFEFISVFYASLSCQGDGGFATMLAMRMRYRVALCVSFVVINRFMLLLIVLIYMFHFQQPLAKRD
jgi:hypothetical protein